MKDLLLPVVDLKVIDPLSLCSPSGQTRIKFIKHFDFRADSKQKKKLVLKLRKYADLRRTEKSKCAWVLLEKTSDQATSEAH